MDKQPDRERSSGSPDGTLRQRVRRKAGRAREGTFDRIRRGRAQAVVTLMIVAICVTAGGALAIRLLHLSKDGQDLGLSESIWESMIRTLDPGQLDVFSSEAEHSGRWSFALVALLLTLFGILLVASLISIINNNVAAWVDKSARGRSRAPKIKREPYIVMLGWSDLSRRILRELAASAKDEESVPQVLVLAPLEIAEMEQVVDELRQHELRKRDRADVSNPWAPVPRHWPDFRTGDPTDTHDLLDLAAIDKASSVIVLAPTEHRDAAPGAGGNCSAEGAEVVKTVFAVGTALAGSGATPAPNPLPVVVEIPEGSADRELAKWISKVHTPSDGRSDLLRVIPVDTPRIQSRLAAQTVRRSGLSDVYVDLMNFDDHEIYAAVPVPELESRTAPTFGDAVASFTNGVVIGLLDADSRWVRWPGWDEPVEGRQLVVINRYQPPEVRVPAETDGAPHGTRAPGTEFRATSEDVLVVGWNDHAELFLDDLGDYVADDTVINVVLDPGTAAAAANYSPRNGVLLHVATDGLLNWVVEGLDEAAFRPLGDAQLATTPRTLSATGHIVLLADTAVPAAVSDAQVLIMQKALHPPKVGGRDATVVAELRERPNRSLASRHRQHDLIVGHGVTALLIAQFARNPGKEAALSELLWGSSVEIDLVPVRAIGEQSLIQTFGDLRTACWDVGFIAFGYRQNEAGARPKLRINPELDAPVAASDDAIVVRRAPTGRSRD